MNKNKVIFWNIFYFICNYQKVLGQKIVDGTVKTNLSLFLIDAELLLAINFARMWFCT